MNPFALDYLVLLPHLLLTTLFLGLSVTFLSFFKELVLFSLVIRSAPLTACHFALSSEKCIQVFESMIEERLPVKWSEIYNVIERRLSMASFPL